MRIFEGMLILVNMVSLLLGIKKLSKVLWFGIAGINLTVLIIHGIFEGFRYQMAFSYMYVILLMILTLTKAAGRFLNTKILTVLGDLFSHGGGTTMEVQTSQSEEFASHGNI